MTARPEESINDRRRAGRPKLSQPRVAEMIADELRVRIVSGQLEDGSILGRQEDLVQEFGVSLPSLREAMRILETEGLISVRRGNIGGAVVHRPTTQGAAFMLGLVLQANKVVVGDLATALGVVEPTCAAMCARHPSHRAIAARLHELTRRAAAQLEVGAVFTPVAREFHDELARSCGNETLRQVVGTLESLWSDYESHWAHASSRTGAYPTVEERRSVLAAHDAITEAIRRGDAATAERASRRHLDATQRLLLNAVGDQPLSVYPAARRIRLGALRDISRVKT
jgi:GntR family transcriptional regulator, transcriptional repressor for pyruvate dehydrogenase complex